MEENTEIKTVSPIETALAKENVTNQVIQKLKENYLGLTINGLEDKKGFKAVEDARKECKSIRNLAVKICEKGRAAAIQEQKDWIAKQKEVVAEIEIVEGYLETQSNAIKELEKKILFEAAQKEKLPARKEKLSLIGFEVEDAELLKIDDNQYDALYNDFYKKHLEAEAEKLRVENERIAAQKAEEERIKREEEQRINKLAEERKNRLIPYWNYVPTAYKSLHMGMGTEIEFNSILEESKKAHDKFELEQENQRKENARLKAEAEAKEKALAEERAKQEEERKKIEAEAQRKVMEAEAKAKAEREAAEKKAAEEKAKQDAIIAKQKEEADKIAKELQAEKDRQAAIEKAKQEAEAKAKAEAEQKEKERLAAEKKAAKAPVKEQLTKWINSFEYKEIPTAIKKDSEEEVVAINIAARFKGFKKWANEQIESL